MPAAAPVEDRRRRREGNPHHQRRLLTLRLTGSSPNGRSHHHQPTSDPRCLPTPTGWNCGASPPTAALAVQLTQNTIPEVRRRTLARRVAVRCSSREPTTGWSRTTTPTCFWCRPREARPARCCPTSRTKCSRASWSADSKSIWMVVNMGVHSQLFQVDHRDRENRGRSPTVTIRSSPLLEHRRRPSGVHDRRADADRRRVDVDDRAILRRYASPRLRLSRSRLRSCRGRSESSGRAPMASRDRGPSHLSDRLQARHALSAGRAAARWTRSVRSIRLGVDSSTTTSPRGRRRATPFCDRTIVAAQGTAMRFIASRSAATSRTAISTCWPASIG